MVMYILYKRELCSKYTTEVLQNKYYNTGNTTQVNNTITTTQVTTTTLVVIFQNILTNFVLSPSINKTSVNTAMLRYQSVQ